VRDQAIVNIAQRWSQSDVRAALAWTQSLPGGELQDRALRSVLVSWVQSEPDTAA
jgi:hypothetical protein